jgi:DNA-binding phage protein
MSKNIKAAVSHHEREVAELRADRELAVEYLKAAMESLDDPDDRAAGLLALRTVAEAYGGLGAVDAEAGISLMKKTVKYTLDSANPLPFTKKQKAELKALSEMPDRKINYCDIPSSLDAQLLEVKKTVSQH